PLPARPQAEVARDETPQPADAGVAAQAVEQDGTPASIDGVLREILEAEVEAHMVTLRGWLQQSQLQPQPVSDPLLRAVHTMNGAFAMTDVPEITTVTGAAESYIKRALAAAELPS